MIKKRKLFGPINIFKFAIAGTVILLSTYSIIFYDTSDLRIIRRLNIVTQFLLFVMFLVSGIHDLKDENKMVRVTSVFSIIVAMIVLVLNLLTIYTIISRGQRI